MKKLLFSVLFLILLPCFAFGANVAPPASLKVNPAVQKKINTQKIKPGQLQQQPENAAMKIISIAFDTTSTGNWGFIYELVNPGLVNFPAGKLHYTAVQQLKTGNATKVTILQKKNRRGFLHGTKRSYHAPLYRCSLASMLELKIIYKGNVLDQMTVRIPPMDVKLVTAYAKNGRYTARLQNRTSYAAKVTLRTAARIAGSSSSPTSIVSHVSDANTVKGPETVVVIPANSIKVSTGQVVAGDKPYISVLFKDERQCGGKGYGILASKKLHLPTKKDIMEELSDKKVSDGLKPGVPESAQQGPPAKRLRPPEDY